MSNTLMKYNETTSLVIKCQSTKMKKIDEVNNAQFELITIKSINKEFDISQVLKKRKLWSGCSAVSDEN